MKTYDVTIRATVVKTIRVQADDEDAAYIEAHEVFDVTDPGDRERYDEETVDLREVTA
jgi:hypothetical protein